jgi:hypothetical protein
VIIWPEGRFLPGSYAARTRRDFSLRSSPALTIGAILDRHTDLWLTLGKLQWYLPAMRRTVRALPVLVNRPAHNGNGSRAFLHRRPDSLGRQSVFATKPIKIGGDSMGNPTTCQRRCTRSGPATPKNFTFSGASGLSKPSW